MAAAPAAVAAPAAGLGAATGTMMRAGGAAAVGPTRSAFTSSSCNDDRDQTTHFRGPSDQTTDYRLQTQYRTAPW